MSVRALGRGPGVAVGWLVLWLALVSAAAPVSASRDAFRDALAELASGAGPRYATLRAGLNDYPLAVYLDYEYLRAGLSRVTPAEAGDFMARAQGSPLANRFLDAYLRDLGSRRRWQAFLAVQPDPPRAERLQCFYYRALWSTGDRAAAYNGAAALWNVGKSQDDACDPLFREWIADGGPDDALVWSRALKAFDRRNPQLIRYLERFASPALKPLLTELGDVYRHPDRLVRDSHHPGPRHAELMSRGIQRLARVNPEAGRQALNRARAVQPFTTEQITAMESMIARHSLFAVSAAPPGWLVDTLRRLRDDELTAIYLRRQLETGDWQALLDGLGWLSAEAQAHTEWRYWRARALEARGEPQTARVLFEALAGERDYHGFLAAQQLGRPAVLNDVGLVPGGAPEDSGYARVTELMALGRTGDAHAEWTLLLGRHDTDAQLALADQALAQGWARFAIDATIAARAWDVLALRFPVVHATEFAAAATTTGADTAELLAIARRESALWPQARSSAGARGLMQLMPTTARQVAKATNRSYQPALLYEPAYNIALGSRYYADLLDRFDGNRPKALAGYNAGPHRVDRWSRGDRGVDQWIDSIPFRETREYVRAVLAYTVIYRARAGTPASLLSETELSQRY